jgi:hypothetical protein
MKMQERVFANWSLKKTSPWHLATCEGNDQDKGTLCGKTHKRHAEWSQSNEPDGIICEKCSALDKRSTWEGTA